MNLCIYQSYQFIFLLNNKNYLILHKIILLKNDYIYIHTTEVVLYIHIFKYFKIYIFFSFLYIILLFY